VPRQAGAGLDSAGAVLSSLYPLFPGANELDQINKIHDIVGTPAPHVLAKIRKNSQHMTMKFPEKSGKGATVAAGCAASLLNRPPDEASARVSSCQGWPACCRTVAKIVLAF
jgi:hypothetical protein